MKICIYASLICVTFNFSLVQSITGEWVHTNSISSKKVDLLPTHTMTRMKKEHTMLREDDIPEISVAFEAHIHFSSVFCISGICVSQH
ncbi:hypothetical protein Y032_0008g297 [Ancylostoma ceylanicum]|uniref:Peptidase M12A domain-containing protein n=1 Tax=Ancylostoma ceylanicum TaxID=53326 RepID=A0A016VKC3_9BILA|nr:hypothetical protein Y032_0008g297 [Ancylostoma ceylanicum]